MKLTSEKIHVVDGVVPLWLCVLNDKEMGADHKLGVNLLIVKHAC